MKVSHRRFVAFVATFGFYIGMGSSGAFRDVCNAQGGCTGPMPPPIPAADLNYNRGLTNDSGIPYFIDAAASREERSQIAAAFTAWQAALESTSKHLTFILTMDAALVETSGIEVVVGTTTPGDPANFRVVSRDPETYELRAARITIDLRGGPSTGRLYFDPELPGYDANGSTPGAITKAMMHEVGHSLGIHHFAGRACTEQRSGMSVMNGMCGINDNGAVLDGVRRLPALANKPAPCDVAAVWAVTVSGRR